MKHFLLSGIICWLTLTAVAQTGSPKYEFRAVWVATVNNIDWPSRPGLTTAEQQKEIIDILNLQQQLGMNTIILQVRPESDAFYHSQLEPWSRYLTGTPGKAPDPFYDPLEFWITQCHERGMELHAWLNPFRVAQNYKKPLAGNHIAFEHPEWILQYGDQLYFDPGLPQTRLFVNEVVRDMVKRYDVDAIHFDDYFYPYPLQNPFPDTTSFRLYNRGFGKEAKADWRRENVDMIIESLNQTIKTEKPWVKFGISPFGVWRNKTEDPDGSDTKAGATNYDHLYANVIKWQQKGWIDYCLPQLYWQVGHPLADFKMLASWWKDHSYGKAMYIGHGIYKSDRNSATPEWTMAGEIPGQIRLLREMKGLGGSAFYSSKHFNRDLMGFQDSLLANLYNRAAIAPPMPWLDDVPPQKVKDFKRRGRTIKWKTEETHIESDKPHRFIIYLNEKGNPCNLEDPAYIYTIINGHEFKFNRINKKKKKYEVRVSVLDRLNNESMPSKPVVVKM